MLKIWGRSSSSNVAKVCWACGEMGLEFERYDVGGDFGGNDTPEYLAMNPNGRVPTIDDDGFILWESNAIVRYLARKHDQGGLCPSDPQAYADADRWMDWQQTTLGPAFGPYFRQMVMTPAAEHKQAVMDAAVEATGEVLGILERHLQGRQFMLGDRLTMADIPLCAVIYRWFEMDIDRPSLPTLEAYYRRLAGREAFQNYAALMRK